LLGRYLSHLADYNRMIGVILLPIAHVKVADQIKIRELP
jgi:hypothetical protein